MFSSKKEQVSLEKRLISGIKYKISQVSFPTSQNEEVIKNDGDVATGCRSELKRTSMAKSGSN